MIKYVKDDVSIRDSLKKVSQRGLGSHRTHGTTPGLRVSYRCHVVLLGNDLCGAAVY
jgi:hypothetical protein